MERLTEAKQLNPAIRNSQGDALPQSDSNVDDDGKNSGKNKGI